MLNSSRVACRCGLPLFAPPEVRCWRPAFEPEPSFTLAPYGCEPALFRAIRTPSGWLLRGMHVSDVIVPWMEIGTCQYGTPHPVIEAHPVIRSTGSPT